MSIKPAPELFLKGKLNPYSEKHQQVMGNLSRLAENGPQTSSEEVPDDKPTTMHDLFNESLAKLAGAPKADSAPPKSRDFQQLNGGSPLCGPVAPKVKENMPRLSINVQPTQSGLPAGNLPFGLAFRESLSEARNDLQTPKGDFTHPVPPAPESPSLEESPEVVLRGSLRDGTPKHAGERDSFHKLAKLAERKPTPKAPTSISEGLNLALAAMQKGQPQGK